MRYHPLLDTQLFEQFDIAITRISTLHLYIFPVDTHLPMPSIASQRQQWPGHRWGCYQWIPHYFTYILKNERSSNNEWPMSINLSFFIIWYLHEIVFVLLHPHKIPEPIPMACVSNIFISPMVIVNLWNRWIVIARCEISGGFWGNHPQSWPNFSTSFRWVAMIQPVVSLTGWCTLW